MPIDAVGLAGGALSGAVVTSIIAPLITQRGERRDVRAEVLRSLAAVERARWAPSTFEELRAATVALRAAGLVAGANRAVLDRYVLLAAVGWRNSTDSHEELADPEMGGGVIDGGLANLIRDASTTLADHLWRPYRTRRALSRALAQSEDRERLLRQERPAPGGPGYPFEGINWNGPVL
jgi:hypothetical protein